MVLNDSQFDNVPLNSNMKTACSPRPPGPTWRGILIQAPQRVNFRQGATIGEHGAFAAIPICGYLLMDVPPVAIDENMRLVAVDARTGHVYSGEIIKQDESPQVPPPDEPSSPKDRQGLAAGGFFNPNLADYVSLPAIPATYTVHVDFRGYRSNQVTIELVQE